MFISEVSFQILSLYFYSPWLDDWQIKETWHSAELWLNEIVKVVGIFVFAVTSQHARGLVNEYLLGYTPTI